MGKMKAHMMAIEDLCLEAQCCGAVSPQDFYLYVRDRMKNITFDDVYYVLCILKS